MPDSLTALETALAYHDRGWLIFPCRGNTIPDSDLREKKKPLVNWRSDFRGDLRPTREQIVQWWTDWPNAWIGCALGRCSDLLRIDVDSAQAAEEFAKLGGAPEATLEFRTVGGGHGYLYRYYPGTKTRHLWKGTGLHEELKLQSDGAFTVVPSPNSGYEWLTAEEPARLPQWIRDTVVENVLMVLERELYPELRPYERELDFPEIREALEYMKATADDYDTWWRVGVALHSCDAPFEVWDEWSRNSPKYKDGECRRLWDGFQKRPGGLNSRSIMRMAQKLGYVEKSRYENLDDPANARVLARHIHGRIKHSNALGWLTWDGRRWTDHVEVGDKEVMQEQMRLLEQRKADTIASINRMLSRGPGADEATFKVKLKGKMSFLNQLCSIATDRRMAGVRHLAGSHPLVNCTFEEFDKNPMLLNCMNGTLDLETLALRDHCPDDHIMQLAPTEFDPSAQCPRWVQFIDEVFGNDKEMVDWIQKLLGYCLTGLTDLHILPILWGTGRNGKSTLMAALRAVLGPEYTGMAPSHFLVMTRGEQHPTKLMTLIGKRMVLDAESAEGMQLDEALIKTLTGEDVITARKMHKDFISFKPTFKLFMMTNYEPTVKGADDAIWGRILKVPFLQSFLGREDFKLHSKLLAETPGILSWLVDGCTKWQKEGLKPYPEAVKTATAEYKQAENYYLRFFEERLLRDVQATTLKQEVTQAFINWCHGNSVKYEANPTRFGIELKKWYGEGAENLTKRGNPKYFGLELIKQ